MERQKFLTKIFISVVIFLFSFTSLSSAPVLAASTVVSGTIQEINSIGGGQFELIVKDNLGVRRFVVDSSTLVQVAIPAEDVEVGNEVLVLPRKKGGGIKEMSSFKNIPAPIRKKLGLPDLPDIPEVPRIPEVPKVPKIPKPSPPAPKVPKTPKIPKAPKAGGPETPPSGGGQAQQSSAGGDVSAAASEEEGQAEGEDMVAREEQPDIPAPPREAGSSVFKPDALKAPTPTLEKIHGKKVVQVKREKDGIEMEMIGGTGEKEKVVLTPEDKVLQFIDIEYLKKNMTIQMEVASSPEGNYVQRVTIA